MGRKIKEASSKVKAAGRAFNPKLLLAAAVAAYAREVASLASELEPDFREGKFDPDARSKSEEIEATNRAGDAAGNRFFALIDHCAARPVCRDPRRALLVLAVSVGAIDAPRYFRGSPPREHEFWQQLAGYCLARDLFTVAVERGWCTQPQAFRVAP